MPTARVKELITHKLKHCRGSEARGIDISAPSLTDRLSGQVSMQYSYYGTIDVAEHVIIANYLWGTDLCHQAEAC
jgi:hypothetical protein